MAENSFFKNFLSRFYSDLWQKKGESILGVDFGFSSLKIVQLRKEKERAVLETYGELSVSHYADIGVGQAAILSEDKKTEMLKDLFKESGAKAEKVVSSISLKNSFVITIELPKMADRDLAQAIPYEARRYIPVPITEVEMDWWVLPEEYNAEEKRPDEKLKKEMIRALLVVIHKDILTRQRSFFTNANLKSIAFEVEIFSMVRSSLGRELTPILLIDLGASSTKMAIVDYGIVRVAHSLDKGGQDISEVLSRSLNIDFSRAEKIKRETGLSDQPEHREIKEVISPILDYIFSEAASFSLNYRVKYGRSVSRVALTGGGALMKGIKDFSINKFGLEVSLADPFAKLEYPAFLEPALKEIGPNFATAIGLALRGLN
ncbi:MAG: type IV pilus assembly protein PilM [Candidatus Niyogibacteria bacterium]|nr:type IV pilus assembly protein PilM [Candidatus Niyogibacteria bacterium]